MPGPDTPPLAKVRAPCPGCGQKNLPRPKTQVCAECQGWLALRRLIAERCSMLEPIVVIKKYASGEELRDYKPGASELNPEPDAWGWVKWICQLSRFLGREELAEQGLVDDERALLDALRAEPEAVQLSIPVDGGGHLVVHVHPKSYDALLHLQIRDRILAYCARMVDELMGSPAIAGMDLLERAIEELSYQQQLMLWTVTHPGPGLPYDPGDPRPLPPSWCARAEPFDVVRILRAYLSVNAGRLAATKTLAAPETPEDGGQRPSWAIFMGTLADKRGVDETHLMRDVSLASLVAGVRLAVASRTMAEAEAKRERGADTERDFASIGGEG